jgi:hypothetical protein
MAADPVGYKLGVKENEEKYQVWKDDTLARQTGHIGAVQTTGAWHTKDIINEDKDSNNIVIEIAPGYR